MIAPARHEPLTSALRLVVAFAGLVIYLADPSEHPARRPFAFAVLLAFVAWGVAMYLLAARRVRTLPSAALPWADLGWVTLLVAVSQGTSGIFYPLYLFVILCASFGQGFRAGMAVTIASVVSFAAIGALTAPRGSVVALHFFVVRPLYLLVLGYLTAVWGGHEVRSRARLALLREVTTLSNPRFGIGRTVGRFLEAVRAHFDADSCRLVVAEEKESRVWMRTAERGAPVQPDRVALPDGLREVLLPATGAGAFLVHHRRRWLGSDRTEIETTGPAEGTAAEAREAAAALAGALEAGSLLSVPFRYHASAPGRIHVVRRRPLPFDRAEVEFLQQALDQVVPMLENIRLVDRLASDAAGEERLRIARDLHDSVIQPYLGLRIGLSAARSAFDAGRPDEAGAHVARLADLADGEIETLRAYVRDLRTGEADAGRGLLDAGLRRFCSRFAEATGIHVEVATEGPPVRNDRLAAEVFQMVAEGLSNVRRHTHATRSDVRIRSAGDRLELTISNDVAGPEDVTFFPRSLGERAAALGGEVTVLHPEARTTAVRVDIPL